MEIADYVRILRRDWRVVAICFIDSRKSRLSTTMATPSTPSRLGADVFAAIKRNIPERFKGPVLAALQSGEDPKFSALSDGPKAVVALAGFYQNLGDMALTLAQKRFIEATLPDHQVVLFASTSTYSRMKALRRALAPGDIVTTIAGGNMDDIYTSLEDARRFIVRCFPGNPVISFPQTIAFSSTDEGRRRLARSARTYARHRRMWIFAREPKSLQIMQDAFAANEVGYCPDIVLSLEPQWVEGPRDGILLCLRDDKEVLLSTLR